MVGLLSEESKRDANRAKHALQVLADASGASANVPKDLVDVEKVTLGIAGEIRRQYIIEYNPVNQNFDGGFRPVRVAVNAPGKPAVRTRTGLLRHSGCAGIQVQNVDIGTGLVQVEISIISFYGNPAAVVA